MFFLCAGLVLPSTIMLVHHFIPYSTRPLFVPMLMDTLGVSMVYVLDTWSTFFHLAPFSLALGFLFLSESYASSRD